MLTLFSCAVQWHQLWIKTISALPWHPRCCSTRCSSADRAARVQHSLSKYFHSNSVGFGCQGWAVCSTLPRCFSSVLCPNTGSCVGVGGFLSFMTFLKYTAVGGGASSFRSFLQQLWFWDFSITMIAAKTAFFSTLISLSWCCYDSLSGDLENCFRLPKLAQQTADLLQCGSECLRGWTAAIQLPKHCPRVKGRNDLLWKLEVCTARKDK